MTTARTFVCAFVTLLACLGLWPSPAAATCKFYCAVEFVDDACTSDPSRTVDGELRVTAQCYDSCSALGGPPTTHPSDEIAPVGLWVVGDGVLTGQLAGTFEPDGTCGEVPRYRWVGSPLCTGAYSIQAIKGGAFFEVASAPSGCALVLEPDAKAISQKLWLGAQAGSRAH